MNTAKDLRVELMIDDQLYIAHGTVSESEIVVTYVNCSINMLYRHGPQIRGALRNEYLNQTRMYEP